MLAVLAGKPAGYFCSELEKIVLVQALVRIACDLNPDTMNVDRRSGHGAGGQGL